MNFRGLTRKFLIKIRGKETKHSMQNRVPSFKSLPRNRCRFGLNLLGFVLLAMLCTPKPVHAIYLAEYNGTHAQVSAASSLSPATFSSPDGLALDLAGNLYIADTGNNRILKAPAGSATAALFAVSIGGTAATFSGPRKLAVDSAGNLYIADTGNNRVVKSDPLGNGTVLSIGSSLSPATLNGPRGVAVDTVGDVFISDTGNNRIVELPSAGAPTVLVTTGIALTTLNSPRGLAVDTYNNLYITDRNNNRVIKVTQPSLVATNFTADFPGYAGSISDPDAVATAKNGVVYILDENVGADGYRVAVIEPQGNQYDLFSDMNNSSFGVPTAIAVDSKGAFYLTDTEGNSVISFIRVRQTSAKFSWEVPALRRR